MHAATRSRGQPVTTPAREKFRYRHMGTVSAGKLDLSMEHIGVYKLLLNACGQHHLQSNLLEPMTLPPTLLRASGAVDRMDQVLGSREAPPAFLRGPDIL